MEEVCPIAFLRVVGALVRKQHVCTGFARFVVIFQYLAGIVSITDLGTVSCPSLEDKFLECLVAHSFADSYAVMFQLEFQTCNHVFPVVVVGGNQKHASARRKIRIKYGRIRAFVSFKEVLTTYGQHFYGLNDKIRQMHIVFVRNPSDFFFVFFWKRVPEIGQYDILSVFHNVLKDETYYIGKQVQQPHGQQRYRH